MKTVAMLYPGYSAEDEFAVLEQRLGAVRLPVVHTWQGPTAHDVDALRALGAKDTLTQACVDALRFAPDAVMWACTSGSFVYGEPGVRDQAAWLSEASGVPASSTSIAFLEAVRALQASAVVIAATYPDDVTTHFVDLLAAGGIHVIGVTSFDVPSGEDAGRLDAQAVSDMVNAAAHQAADVPVLVPDTALHTVELVDDLERRHHRPVLTANVVTAWWGLRLAGDQRPVAGLGRLFALD